MITWVFRVRNERDPYTRRHYSSVHWKGEKKHFCSQKERVPSLRWNIEIGFLSQRLNFRRCTQRPSPPHPSSLLQKNKKQKKTKTTCHHPPRGIHSNLPKKEGKKRDGENNNSNNNNAPRSLRFSPWKKNIRSFYLLWDQALVLFPPSLFSIAFLSLQQGKGTFKACVWRSDAALTSGPLWAEDRSRPEKSLREKIVESWEPARVRESRRTGSAGASSLCRSLTRSERSEPSWTLRAPLLKISHPNLLPSIQSAAIQQKIFLYQDSSNTSQGKPDVK